MDTNTKAKLYEAIWPLFVNFIVYHAPNEDKFVDVLEDIAKKMGMSVPALARLMGPDAQAAFELLTRVRSENGGLLPGELSDRVARFLLYAWKWVGTIDKKLGPDDLPRLFNGAIEHATGSEHRELVGRTARKLIMDFNATEIKKWKKKGKKKKPRGK